MGVGKIGLGSVFALMGCDRSGSCVCVRGGWHRPVWCGGEGIPQSVPIVPGGESSEL